MEICPNDEKQLRESMNSAELTQVALGALEELKARQIVTLDVTHLTDITDTLVIASGTSSRHVKSLANNVSMTMKQQGMQPVGVEGAETGDWVLVDLGDIIVHVMMPEARDFYDLERLWSAPAGADTA
ncbi:MAG: ribosome-associated protein [Halieaceae bacterium]|jgi:ribosome-associated protein